MKVKFILLIIFVMFIGYNYAFAETIEINVLNIIKPNVENNELASKAIAELSDEYNEIRNNNQFNNVFYKKIEGFIKQYPDTTASISALLLIASMCFLEETYELYSGEGMKILDYIISHYPNTPHFKYSLYSKALIKKEEGCPEDSLKLLRDNYEVIISIDNDKNYIKMMKELGNTNITEKFSSEYYLILGLIYFDLNNTTDCVDMMNKIINDYPGTNASKEAKRIIDTAQKLNTPSKL